MLATDSNRIVKLLKFEEKKLSFMRQQPVKKFRKKERNINW